MGADPAEPSQSQTDALPRHKVTISSAFAIGTRELTVRQFRAFVKATGHQPPPCRYFHRGKQEFVEDGGATWDNPTFEQTDSHPVVCVSKRDAQAYVRWLNEHLGAAEEEPLYRLPTEAEWELAARGGTSGTSHWGSTREESDRIACDYANLMDEWNAGSWAGRRFKCDDGFTYPAPVDAQGFKPNAFGLYHVIGNVAEWVQDCWHDGYDGAPQDGRVWQGGDCSKGIARGGNYMYGAQVGVGSHLRAWQLASTPYPQTGFRVARTIGKR